MMFFEELFGNPDTVFQTEGHGSNKLRYSYSRFIKLEIINT